MIANLPKMIRHNWDSNTRNCKWD